MNKSKFTETQIIVILDVGLKVEALCCQYDISSATYYNCKKKYGGADASELTRIRELEDENARLKRMYADQSL